MPFQIIRDDITRVKADAIVDTANPEPRYAGGTDGAIYRAAGAEDLLAARRRIGRIAPGEAAVTAAFALPAKYLIHTVGPAWIDGQHGEFDILRACYRKSLLLADVLGCRSIAFPLIATGVYGFPKDRALETALSVIREHLEQSDLEVTLVVFGRGAYQIAAGLAEKIEAYIDENYAARRIREEYGSSRPGSPSAGGRRIEPSLRACLEGGEEAWEERAVCSADTAGKPVRGSLEDAVNHLGESFQDRLLRMIDERGMTDPEVYKRANLDRKLFSKIRCHEAYIPKKKTILSLAIALRLNLDDTRDLLASAGYALTNNSKSDVIVRFCIENGIYDIYEVNALLFRFDQQVLC